MFRRAEEIEFGKLYRNEIMERMVSAKGFGIFKSIIKNY